MENSESKKTSNNDGWKILGTLALACLAGYGVAKLLEG
jgi:hypothetical protein